MRLQLIGAAPALLVAAGIVAALLLAAATAAAEDRAASWLSVYSDDDGLTVVSPRVTAATAVREVVTVDVELEADVISGATVDVVSAASPRGFSELRYGVGVGAAWERAPGAVVGASFIGSWERDYASRTLALQTSREWLDRRLSTRLSARLAADRVGRAGDDPSLWRDLHGAGLGLGVGWVFNRRTVGELLYEGRVARGFQASPYRFVPITWTGGGTIMVPEAVPERRDRHAAAARLRRALTDRLFLGGGYRLYADSWGITSHTGDLELQRAIGWDTWIVGAAVRGYYQSAARFHRAAYEVDAGTIPALRDADKQLAESWSVRAGARLAANLGERGPLDALRVVLKVEHYRQRFYDFAPLELRRAWIVSLGASGEH